MKALVVYYSRTGTTKALADTLAKELGADVEEIVDLKNRRGIFGFLSAGYSAYRRSLTNIKPPEKDPSAYDTVLLGTPIWASNITPALRTYIVQKKDALKQKRVAFFMTYSGTGLEKAMQSLTDLYGAPPAASLEIVKGIEAGKFKERLDAFTAKLRS